MSNTRPQTRRTPGFTIMELIVVVVIIGVLAAIALPSYQIQMKKMKNQEAVRILMAVWEAQKDYYREHGTYLYNTSNLTPLAVDIPTPKNFGNPLLANGAGDWYSSCSGSDLYVPLSLMFSSGSSPWYVLLVLEDGRIVCTATCSYESICQKMGFPDW